VLTGIRWSDGVMTRDTFWHCLRKEYQAQSHRFQSKLLCGSGSAAEPVRLTTPVQSLLAN
jgi:hypothetical protein